MRAEDELAHQVRAHIKFTQWATLASRRRKAIECYKEQAEDSARAAYLEQFWQAPMSTVVMDYEWPTRGGTPQARPSRSRRKSHALLGLVDVSITDTSSLKESVRAPEGSEVFAMSVAAATPRKHEGRIDTQHATVAQPLHARRKVFHSLNAVKSCVRLTVAATLPCDDGVLPLHASPHEQPLAALSLTTCLRCSGSTRPHDDRARGHLRVQAPPTRPVHPRRRLQARAHADAPSVRPRRQRTVSHGATRERRQPTQIPCGLRSPAVSTGDAPADVTVGSGAAASELGFAVPSSSAAGAVCGVHPPRQRECADASCVGRRTAGRGWCCGHRRRC